MDPVGPTGQTTWRAGRMPVLFALPRNANISLTLLSVPQPHSPTKQCITVAKFALVDALFNYVSKTFCLVKHRAGANTNFTGESNIIQPFLP